MVKRERQSGPVGYAGICMVLLLACFMAGPAWADRVLVLSDSAERCETPLVQQVAVGLASELHMAGYDVADPRTVGISLCDPQGHSLSITEGIRQARALNASSLLVFDVSLVQAPDASGLARRPLDGLWRFSYRVDLFDTASRDSHGHLDGEGLLPTEPTSIFGGECNPVCMANWRKSIAPDIGREIAVDVLFRQGALQNKKQVRLLLRHLPEKTMSAIRAALKENPQVPNIALLQSVEGLETLALSTTLSLAELKEMLVALLQNRQVAAQVNILERPQGALVQVYAEPADYLPSIRTLVLAVIGLVLFILFLSFGRFIRDRGRAHRLLASGDRLSLAEVSLLNRLIDKGWILGGQRAALSLKRRDLNVAQAGAVRLNCAQGEVFLQTANSIEFGRPVQNGAGQDDVTPGDALAAGRIVVDHPQVSRFGRQTRLFLADQHFHVEDLGSTNGTLLVDRPVVGRTLIPEGETHLSLGGEGGPEYFLRTQRDSLVMAHRGAHFWCLGSGPFSFSPLTLSAKGIKPGVFTLPKRRLLVRFSAGVVELRGHMLTAGGVRLYGWIPLANGDRVEWSGEPLTVSLYGEGSS